MDSTNKKVFILFLVNVTTAVFYSMPIPMYPTLAYKRGVDESLVGLIFAIYSVANLVIIPYTNYLIENLGRIKLLLILTLIKVSIYS